MKNVEPQLNPFVLEYLKHWLLMIVSFQNFWISFQKLTVTLCITFSVNEHIMLQEICFINSVI